jgi:hypothetical protein
VGRTRGRPGTCGRSCVPSKLQGVGEDMVVLLRGGGSLCPRTNTYSSRAAETASRISWKAWLWCKRIAEWDGRWRVLSREAYAIRRVPKVGENLKQFLLLQRINLIHRANLQEISNASLADQVCKAGSASEVTLARSLNGGVRATSSKCWLLISL